jgi:hypothetical protein
MNYVRTGMLQRKQRTKTMSILFRFSVLLTNKPKQLAKIAKRDRQFLYRVSNRRYYEASQVEYDKLLKLEEKYL